MQAVSIAFLDEALASPLMNCGTTDAEALSYLVSGEQTTAAQPRVTTSKLIRHPDERDLFQVEGLPLPGTPPTLVQDLSDLPVAVIIKELVDLCHQFRLELADLGDRPGPLKRQSSDSTTRQTDMGCDRFCLDQGDIFNQQTQDALALAHVDTRIMPDFWELFGELQNASARFSIERGSLLIVESVVLSHCVSVHT